MNKSLFFCLLLSLPIAGGGCWTSHKVDITSTHKVEPIEININLNVHIMNELNETFKKQDEVDQQISETEADAALREYLASEK